MSVSHFRKQSLLFLLTVLLLSLPFGFPQTAKAQEFDRMHYIYDDAHLLTSEEAVELQTLAADLGGQRETSFIILTLNGTDGKDIVQYVEDYYDDNAPGYDQPHGNTAILAIDMQERDIYLAGFKKAEQYLNDGRLDVIREEITPALSDGQYFQAFSQFLNISYEYMGQEPTSDSGGYTDYGSSGGYVGQNSYETGSDAENIFFQWWFQLISSLVVAGFVVTIMANRSGGRVTVNGQTYMDRNKSRVLSKYDNFTHQTVTRQRKPQNNSSSGGGGGITGGGHSHSGSRGKF
ncbi:TPM domain-containing protein [Neobacillus niacini]|uniref:TPM domain-containing protein n=1 Tax=Neobacillus niacini TaxID=86668 RepID=UPI0021CB84B6|nr:TPM domain-containing protein [Neobacillus niacini]MCM3766146.1 TPM domain-containing protein [Neobacillus niacini]